MILISKDPEWFNKDPFLISSTATRFRSLLESLVSPGKTNSQTADTLGRFYGTRLFKCSKLACERFRLGFETSQDRDEHMRTRHNRPFKCSNPRCDMSRMGFLTSQSLQSHEDICLPDSPPDSPLQQHSAGTFTITPDMDGPSRWRMLTDAVHAGDQGVAAELFNLGVYRSQVSSYAKGDLLKAAIKSGSTTMVDFILDHDESIDLDQALPNRDYKTTALQSAVSYSAENVAKRLLERGAGVDCRPTVDSWDSRDKFTPFMRACKEGFEPLVRLLLEFNPDISVAHNFKTPLMWAIVAGHETIVKILLAKYPELILQKIQGGCTALRNAAGVAQHQVIQLLLDYGADINADMPLQYVGESFIKPDIDTQKIQETIRFLISMGADIRPTGKSVLSHHTRVGELSTVKLLLEAGADVNTKDCHNRTPLYNACRWSTEAMITLIMQAGADPDIPCGNRGTTSRCLAAFKRWAEKNPSLVPPVKSSMPGLPKGGSSGSQDLDEGDQEIPSSSTPAQRSMLAS